VEVRAEELVEQEELHDGIADEHDLAEDVESDQVVAMTTAQEEAAGTGHEMLERHGTAGTMLSLAHQVPIHLFSHVSECFLSALCQLCALEGLSCLNNVVHVDSGAAVERTPQHNGEVEEQRLHQQDHGHPLVVWNHHSLLILVLFWDVLLEWEIVCISDPAVVVCILLMVAREVSRNPAVDWLSDILFS